MLSCLSRALIRFSTSTVERPFTPSLWNAMNISSLQRLPPQQQLARLLHAVKLMQSGITSFDYDFYHWSCWRVVEQQQELTKEDIMMMMRLGCRHRITIEPFQKHIENEIFLRIHRDYEPQLQQYDEDIRNQIDAVLHKLQAQSKDYFQLIKQQEGQQKEENEEEESEEDTHQISTNRKDDSHALTEKYIVDMNRKLKKRNNSIEFSHNDLIEAMELLKQTGCKNLQLLQYILELLTVKYESSTAINPQEMIQYVQGITYICQHLMAQYSGNRERYTPRSVKRIYKFQTLYYHEHLRQLENTAKELSKTHIEQLIKTYSAFPLKRREIRRRIGGVLGEELKRRHLEEDTEMVKMLVQINGKDEKMKRSYCEMIGFDLEKAKQLGLYKIQSPLLQQKQGESVTEPERVEAQKI